MAEQPIKLAEINDQYWTDKAKLKPPVGYEEVDKSKDRDKWLDAWADGVNSKNEYLTMYFLHKDYRHRALNSTWPHHDYLCSMTDILERAVVQAARDQGLI